MDKILVFTGGLAAGKTTTMELLAERYQMKIIPSFVSRAPRKSDPVGDYEHGSWLDIWTAYRRGELISCPSETSYELYGMRKKNVERAILEGGLQGRSIIPDSIEAWHKFAGDKMIFFHLPTPSKEETFRRVIERGEMTIGAFEERIINEKRMDSKVLQLIESGIKIHLLPRDCVEKTLQNVVNMIFGI